MQPGRGRCRAQSNGNEVGVELALSPQTHQEFPGLSSDPGPEGMNSSTNEVPQKYPRSRHPEPVD